MEKRHHRKSILPVGKLLLLLFCLLLCSKAELNLVSSNDFIEVFNKTGDSVVKLEIAGFRDYMHFTGNGKANLKLRAINKFSIISSKMLNIPLPVVVKERIEFVCKSWRFMLLKYRIINRSFGILNYDKSLLIDFFKNF